jgi:hypothetical protein
MEAVSSAEMPVRIYSDKSRRILFLKYGMATMSANPKHSVVVMGMFRFKPASQFAEWLYGVVSCETPRLPQFLENRLTDGRAAVTFTHKPPLPPGRFLVLISVRG